MIVTNLQDDTLQLLRQYRGLKPTNVGAQNNVARDIINKLERDIENSMDVDHETEKNFIKEERETDHLLTVQCNSTDMKPSVIKDLMSYRRDGSNRRVVEAGFDQIRGVTMGRLEVRTTNKSRGSNITDDTRWLARWLDAAGIRHGEVTKV
jgi:hypothetical protein